MNDKQKARWTKIRAKGKLRFVLIVGTLTVLVFVLVSLAFDSLWDYWLGIPSDPPPTTNVILLKLIVKVLYGAVFGLLTSLIIWWGAEKSYRDSEGIEGNWDSWNKQGSDPF